jgi:hypothetical protein
MLPCYKGHKNSNEGTQKDLKQQEHNNTPGQKLKGLEEEEEEPEKYNPSKERDKYEILIKHNSNGNHKQENQRVY